ncbi:aspartate carbamoyltransferase [Tindallia californiensis]|uniref:Aspartate carbamoyltransferase n=1 Tax=Tindallia californiensis TaxID=159292 RepID=A0A1H3Q2K5_9FIRM|nr:aspartate carbamoyltransferase [Tindallia californiensis]SDZ07245.1 aspartate carbamoyltransferase [Tindallia californiensis]
MNLEGRHLIDPRDLSVTELTELLDLGLKMYENPAIFADACHGKILGTLFYEPSTRTRLSFESAMLRLGGRVLGFSDAATSSASKGESLADTIRVLDDYADVLVMRHPREGAPRLAAEYSTAPVINGGDGGHQHPTQTLTDLLTLKKYLGKIENLKVAFCGDLLFGRTVHSLIKTLSRFPGMEFFLISPPELRIPYHLKEELLEEYEVKVTETSQLEDCITEIDLLYMTRIQKERFFNEEEYVKLKDSFILSREKLAPAKDSLLVLHPLPRVNEIQYDVDEDPRARYFDQAKMGVYIRMALICAVLGVKLPC